MHDAQHRLYGLLRGNSQGRRNKDHRRDKAPASSQSAVCICNFGRRHEMSGERGGGPFASFFHWEALPRGPGMMLSMTAEAWDPERTVYTGEGVCMQVRIVCLCATEEWGPDTGIPCMAVSTVQYSMDDSSHGVQVLHISVKGKTSGPECSLGFF